MPWLDNIKFFAIFCVVLGHVLGFLTNHEIVGYELVQGIIVSFKYALIFYLIWIFFRRKNIKYY